MDKTRTAKGDYIHSEETLKDTIVIMGNADSKDKYDWTRTDADVFVFNEAANTAFKGKPVSGVFQLHEPVIWKNPNNRNDPTHYQWLKNTKLTVFMQDKYEDVPSSVKFPRDEVMEVLKNAKTESGQIREVSCTPAWAVAYAIHAGYKRIECYGVELSSNTEYAYQQGNFKFWLGIAIGRGVEVFLATSMFDNPQYGYEGEVEIPYDTFEQRIAELMPHREAAFAKYQAAQKEVSKLIDDFLNGDNTKELTAGVGKLAQIGGELGNIEGARQANEHYKNKADDMIKTSERFIFSRQEFEHNARQAQNAAVEIQAQFNGLGGQLNLIHSSIINSAKQSPKRKRLLESYKQTFINYMNANNEVAGWTGAANENLRYMARLDAGVKAAGGVKSEEAILGQK